MKVIMQSLVIILSTFITFVIVNTELEDYTVYFLAAVILLAMTVVMIRKLQKKEEIFVGSNLDMFTITTAILLTIFLTGTIASPVFFLLYFLMFGTAFLFEPVIIFVMITAIVLLFGQEAVKNDMVANVLRLGSLVLLSPLAFFFGNEYKKREKMEQQILEASEKIKEDVEVLAEDDKNLSTKSEEAIDDIVQQAESIQKEVTK